MNYFSAKKISCTSTNTCEDDLKHSFEATDVYQQIIPKSHLGYRHSDSVSLTERGSIVLKSITSLHQEGEAGKTYIDDGQIMDLSLFQQGKEENHFFSSQKQDQILFNLQVVIYKTY